MKYAFKVTRFPKKGLVTVSQNIYPVPDDAEPNIRVQTGMVEVIHVYRTREEAHAAKSWESAASHFHRYTRQHLSELIRADVARAAAIGVSQELLNRWLGRGAHYYFTAADNGNPEPRKVAKLHIFVGLLEQLILRANLNLNEDMRATARSDKGSRPPPSPPDAD